ncbi:hypothetical protein SUGI_0383010 [Cryptomeria japonica]|uniref:homeobox-leucine zipper protein HOX11 n=1 Tax=Cryptomeria japonica TaxID=3369 RepID=UPI002408B043|nr:homeobox-leucine zipper protein HOX11 [Cryptomeria japonica]GLJ20963.1 hypothetical protein SUGI_0383010 [Cryptomeria japonica]
MGVSVEESRTRDLLSLRLASSSAPDVQWGLMGGEPIASSGGDICEKGKMKCNYRRRRTMNEEEEEEQAIARKKLRLCKEQYMYLEETFKAHNTLNMEQKLALAQRLNLRPRQIEVWFQNRRARTKAKQTEADFELLKRYCINLKEENGQLSKELQVLKALHIHELAAQCFNLCPSCKQILPTENFDRAE